MEEGVCDETKVVDVEEDGEEGDDVRVGQGEVGVIALDGVDEVGDVETPQEGGEATDFGDTFEDLNVVSLSVNSSRTRYMRDWWRARIRCQRSGGMLY